MLRHLMPKTSTRTISRERVLLAYYSIKYGYAAAARLLGTNSGRAFYWTRKYCDPTFHIGKWGGIRRAVFSADELPMLQQSIFDIVQQYPHTTLKLLCILLSNKFFRFVAASTLSRILRSWKWSWKVPALVQLSKYKLSNVMYYTQFVNFVQNTYWPRLKFADEGHIVERALRGKRILSVKGQRKWLKDNSLHAKSSSLTILVSLTDQNPVYFDFRQQSNTQYDHLDFVWAAVKAGQLKDGDFYIVDNASVHGGAETLPCLISLLDACGVKLMYLPKYSPELNPCELVFNIIKHHLRYHRQFNISIIYDIIEAIAQISLEKVVHAFVKCLDLENVQHKAHFINE
jgi:hypothetical protein